MPSPIAHLGIGYAIYRVTKHKLPRDRLRLWIIPFQLLLVTGLSILPDLDTISAIIFRDLEKYHNNFSHSFIFGFLAAILLAGLLFAAYRSKLWIWFLVSLLSFELHIGMDFFAAERGVMLFWPFTDARFAPPIKLFYGLQWGLGWFSVWHLWTIFTESLFVLGVLIIVNLLEKRISRRTKTLAPKRFEQQEN